MILLYVICHVPNMILLYVTRICNLSCPYNICRSSSIFESVHLYAAMSPEDTIRDCHISKYCYDVIGGMLSCIITISSHLNFLLIDRTLRQGSLDRLTSSRKTITIELGILACLN
jgi:hypothetical protein